MPSAWRESIRGSSAALPAGVACGSLAGDPWDRGPGKGRISGAVCFERIGGPIRGLVWPPAHRRHAGRRARGVRGHCAALASPGPAVSDPPFGLFGVVRLRSIRGRTAAGRAARRRPFPAGSGTPSGPVGVGKRCPGGEAPGPNRPRSWGACPLPRWMSLRTIGPAAPSLHRRGDRQRVAVASGGGDPPGGRAPTAVRSGSGWFHGGRDARRL